MLSRKKRSDGVYEAHALDRIDLAIDGIQRESSDYNDWHSPLRINAFMHKVMLSGLWGDVWGDYKKLWTVFGKLHVDTDFVPSERMPGYKERRIKQDKEFQIFIYLFPIGHRPPYMIEIIPRERASIKDWKDLLKKLHLWFPKLKVSTVDYAIDEYCYDFKGVDKLFCMQLRHLYFPYQRNVNFQGGDWSDFGNGERMNTVYRVDDVKMYERGPDRKKYCEGWLMKDVDRVRFEYSAPRTVLVDHGISGITDLIKHPFFHKINKDIYNFKHFKGSKRLPKLGHDYTIPDENGNAGCFQSEIIGYRNNINNISHYLKDVKEFEVLKSALRDAMKRYDSGWEGA
jgi:hypothetical protein